MTDHRTHPAGARPGRRRGRHGVLGGLVTAALVSVAADAAGAPASTAAGADAQAGSTLGAVPTVVVTAPEPVSAPIGTAIGISGTTLDGFGPHDVVRVQLSASAGAMWLPAGSPGVSVPLGFPDFGVPWSVLSFEGSQSDLNAALDGLQWTSSVPGPATIVVDATLGGASFDPATGHHYMVVDAQNVTWDDARSAAAAERFNGMPGYLATLGSAAEQELVSRTLDGPAWIGASDHETEGTWQWVTGPEGPVTFWDPSCGVALRGECPGKGYASWADAEPDDAGGDEDRALFDAPVGSGWWSDATGGGQGSPSAYVVEFGGGLEAPTYAGRATGQVMASTVPGAPTGASAQPAQASAVVSWATPASDGWSPLVGYLVTGTPDGFCAVLAPQTSCVVTDLTPGVPYTFVVTAANDIGEGAASAPTAAVIPSAPPVVDPVDPVDPGLDWPYEEPDPESGVDDGSYDDGSSDGGGDGGGTETVVESDAGTMDELGAGPSPGPSIHVVFDVGVGTEVGDTVLTVRGAGLAPDAPATVTVHSTPTLLDTVVADDAGAFEQEVTLPADLDDGEHVVVVHGSDPDGADRYRVMAFAVEDAKLSRIGVRRVESSPQGTGASGAAGATDASEVVLDAPAPSGGGGSKLPLLLIVLVLLGGAGALVVLHRRRGMPLIAADQTDPARAGSGGGATGRRAHRPTPASTGPARPGHHSIQL